MINCLSFSVMLTYSLYPPLECFYEAMTDHTVASQSLVL